MSQDDAFHGEMGFPRRLSTEQQERLLAGAPFADGGELDEIAAFARALPAYAREQPDEVLAAALVPRLAEAARSSAAEAHPIVPAIRVRRRSRLRLVARVAVAVALLPALMAAAAFAGVTLPDPARDAFERVGVDLPNQSAVDEGDEGTTGGEEPGTETAEEKRKHRTKKSNPARAQGKRGVAPDQTGSAGNIGNAGSQGKSPTEAQGQGKVGGSARNGPPPQARKPLTPPVQAQPVTPPGQARKVN